MNKSENNEENSLKNQNDINNLKPKNAVSCNCEKSKCVKLYCECYANGDYCNPQCCCYDCLNNVNNEQLRNMAIKYTLQKNPEAFLKSLNKNEENSHMIKGCACKKSNCTKNYCECYQANLKCSKICKCFDCQNKNSWEEDENNNSNNKIFKLFVGFELDEEEKNNINLKSNIFNEEYEILKEKFLLKKNKNIEDKEEYKKDFLESLINIENKLKNNINDFN